MPAEDTLRHGAELYRVAAERSQTRADRDRLLDCAADLAQIAEWVDSRRSPTVAGTAAAGRENADDVAIRDFYASENGDRWQLAHDTASGRVFVRHQANLPSGGHVTDLELAEFLNGPANAPERGALMQLICDLVARTD